MEHNTEFWVFDEITLWVVDGRPKRYVWNNRVLQINPEYQRGRVWSDAQNKRFIDSILRGYPVPFLFMHALNQTDDEGKKVYDIVDGQQRIFALRQYVDIDLKLLTHNEMERNFPSLVLGKHGDENWCGKTFVDLPDKYKNKLKSRQLPVVILEGDESEVRDLFIRLQAGSVLNDQEKRDAWPGDFTRFIFEIGGRNGCKLNPHKFFPKVMGLKSSKRGNIRKIAAQLYQLHSSYANGRQINGIKKTELDRLYMSNQNFNISDPGEKTREQFKRCLDTLCEIFGRTVRGTHWAMHLMLLITSLLKNFEQHECEQVRRDLEETRKEFQRQCIAAAGKMEYQKEQDEYWCKFMINISAQVDSSPRAIKRRHAFFLHKIVENIGASESPEILARMRELLIQEARELDMEDRESQKREQDNSRDDDDD